MTVKKHVFFNAVDSEAQLLDSHANTAIQTSKSNHCPTRLFSDYFNHPRIHWRVCTSKFFCASHHFAAIDNHASWVALYRGCRCIVSPHSNLKRTAVFISNCQTAAGSFLRSAGPACPAPLTSPPTSLALPSTLQDSNLRSGVVPTTRSIPSVGMRMGWVIEIVDFALRNRHSERSQGRNGMTPGMNEKASQTATKGIKF